MAKLHLSDTRFGASQGGLGQHGSARRVTYGRQSQFLAHKQVYGNAREHLLVERGHD